MLWLKERRKDDVPVDLRAKRARCAGRAQRLSRSAGEEGVQLNLAARVREGTRRWSIEVASITTRSVAFDSFAALQIGSLLWVVLPGPRRLAGADRLGRGLSLQLRIHPAAPPCGAGADPRPRRRAPPPSSCRISGRGWRRARAATRAAEPIPIAAPVTSLSCVAPPLRLSASGRRLGAFAGFAGHRLVLSPSSPDARDGGSRRRPPCPSGLIVPPAAAARWIGPAAPVAVGEARAARPRRPRPLPAGSALLPESPSVRPVRRRPRPLPGGSE